MNENAPNRRTVLGTVAGGVATLAGCTNGTVPSSSGTQSNAISEVSTEDFSIKISLRDGNGTDLISVIGPSGAEFMTKEVATGATQVLIEIGTEYDAGKYEIVATREGEQIDKDSIEIRPNLSVRKVFVGENYDENPPENLPYAEEQALVIIENSGRGPDSVNNLSLTGEVPNPTESDNKRKSGIYDSLDGYGAAEEVAIPANSQIRFWSTTKPFLFTGDGVECTSNVQEHAGTVELDFGIYGNLSHQIDLRYTASETADGCDVSIVRE